MISDGDSVSDEAMREVADEILQDATAQIGENEETFEEVEAIVKEIEESTAGLQSAADLVGMGAVVDAEKDHIIADIVAKLGGEPIAR